MRRRKILLITSILMLSLLLTGCNVDNEELINSTLDNFTQGVQEGDAETIEAAFSEEFLEAESDVTIAEVAMQFATISEQFNHFMEMQEEEGEFIFEIRDRSLGEISEDSVVVEGILHVGMKGAPEEEEVKITLKKVDGGWGISLLH